MKYRGIDPSVVEPDPVGHLLDFGSRLSVDQTIVGSSILNETRLYVDELVGWNSVEGNSMRAEVSANSGRDVIYVQRDAPDEHARVLRRDGTDVQNFDIWGYDLRSRTVRSPMEMQTVIDQIESTKRSADICDPTGNKLCTIQYDPLSGEIYEIKTEPYTNEQQEAEHADEYVCVTNEDGSLSGEMLTRAEVREQKKRYLVVSSILWNGEKILIQERSDKKKIDPGMGSASAHGVAKLLFRPDGSPILNPRYAARVNAALELNEELRHGEDTPQFNVVIFPGSERELLLWAYEHKIDDTETVYITGESYDADSGYPFWDRIKKPRTRYLSVAYVFSDSQPNVSIDPHEVKGVKWVNTKEFGCMDNVTEDVDHCVRTSYESMLRSYTQWGFHHSHNFVRRSVANAFGDPMKSEWYDRA